MHRKEVMHAGPFLLQQISSIVSFIIQLWIQKLLLLKCITPENSTLELHVFFWILTAVTLPIMNGKSNASHTNKVPISLSRSLFNESYIVRNEKTNVQSSHRPLVLQFELALMNNEIRSLLES